MRLKIVCPNCGRGMIGLIKEKDISKILLFCSYECYLNYYSAERKEEEKQAVSNRFEIMDL